MTRRKRYSAEFKREALRRADEVGVTDVLVAEELGINARMLRYWRDAANVCPGSARQNAKARLCVQPRMRRSAPLDTAGGQCWSIFPAGC